MRAKGGTVGRCCESGWSDVEGQAGTAAISELAARTRGASFDATAPVGPSQTAPLHHDRDLARAAVGDSTVQTGAAIGPHPTLHAVADL